VKASKKGSDQSAEFKKRINREGIEEKVKE